MSATSDSWCWCIIIIRACGQSSPVTGEDWPHARVPYLLDFPSTVCKQCTHVLGTQLELKFRKKFTWWKFETSTSGLKSSTLTERPSDIFSIECRCSRASADYKQNLVRVNAWVDLVYCLFAWVDLLYCLFAVCCTLSECRSILRLLY